MMRWTVPGIVVSLGLGAFLVASAAAEPTADRTVAQTVLAELAAPALSASAPLVKRPVAEAQRALERAKGARQAGDVARAELLEGLAREWAETARDTVRAASAETDAVATDKKVAQAVVQTDRARTLLEESIAHLGEARQRLTELEQQNVAAKPKAKPVKKEEAP